MSLGEGISMHQIKGKLLALWDSAYCSISFYEKEKKNSTIRYHCVSVHCKLCVDIQLEAKVFNPLDFFH